MKLPNLFVRLVIPACALLFSGNINAQTESPVKLGLKVSPNLSWMYLTTDKYTAGKISVGAKVGLIGEFYFAERYAFVTGLDFLFLNGNLKYPDSVSIDNFRGRGDMTRKIKLIYLEVPLILKMNTKQFGDFSFYGMAGFAAGFNLSARTNDQFVSNSGNTYKGKSDFGGNTALIRGSVNIGVGTEFHLDASTKILAGITYSNALNNILKDENNLTHLSVKSWLNYLELNLGILF